MEEDYGYLQLIFPNITYTLDSLGVVVLGRHHKDCELLPYKFVSVGDAKTLSREHARLDFDAKKGKWTLECIGRHGFRHNGTPVMAGSIVPLKSEDRIEMAGIVFFILFPKSESKTPTRGKGRSKGSKHAESSTDVATTPSLPLNVGFASMTDGNTSSQEYTQPFEVEESRMESLTSTAEATTTATSDTPLNTSSTMALQ